MVVVDLLMVGHLGASELAAAGLGNNFFDLIQHPIFGCATALDTLLAQAHGAGQFEMYGKWTQTGLLLLLLLSVPYAILLAFASPVLEAAGVDATLASRAGLFCFHLIPGVPAHLLFAVLTKYLQAQSLVTPSVVVALIANIANATLNWVLIHALGLGFIGAPMATSASRWVQLLLMLAYMGMRRSKLAPTLPSTRVIWRELPRMSARFFRLGAPGALMLALEAWFFEASTFMAARLGQTPFDAHVVLLNVRASTYASSSPSSFLRCPHLILLYRTPHSTLLPIFSHSVAILVLLCCPPHPASLGARCAPSPSSPSRSRLASPCPSASARRSAPARRPPPAAQPCSHSSSCSHQ